MKNKNSVKLKIMALFPHFSLIVDKKKETEKSYKELAKSISWLDTRQFFPRSKTSSASLALDQTQMQPKIVMLLSAF